jgi:hypothetical protein
MSKAPISLRLVPEHKVRLVLEAKRQMIECALLEADKGAFVSEELMTKWFLSLGTANEIPEPDVDFFVICI